MPEVPESLKQFIARDLIYVIGGGSVLTTVLYRFDRFPAGEVPVGVQGLTVGIAYVLGYLLQDSFSLIGLVTTARVPKPSRLLKYLYKRFTGEMWRDLGEVQWDQQRPALRNELRDAQERAEYQRVITLMMVGSTMAPSALMVGGLLAWKRLSDVGADAVFDLTLAIGSVVIALLFLTLDWLKAAQLAAIEAEMIHDYQKSAAGSRDV